jgi:hypothetical protein
MNVALVYFRTVPLLALALLRPIIRSAARSSVMFDREMARTSSCPILRRNPSLKKSF